MERTLSKEAAGGPGQVRQWLADRVERTCGKVVDRAGEVAAGGSVKSHIRMRISRQEQLGSKTDSAT